MTQYRDQQLLRQQPQVVELPHSQTAIAQSNQPITTTESVTTPSLGQLDTVALVQYGGITTAIILSIAVLILALAEYNKVFVMLQKSDQKTE